MEDGEGQNRGAWNREVGPDRGEQERFPKKVKLCWEVKEDWDLKR